MDQPLRFVNLEESWGYGRSTIDYIQHAAAHGLYEIRGLGAKRKLPHFDDLLFLAASLSRYPLEGYRERCETKTILGSRFAKKPDCRLRPEPAREAASSGPPPHLKNRRSGIETSLVTSGPSRRENQR